MGATADRPAPWERERRLTDILEGVALLVRAVARLLSRKPAQSENRAAAAAAGSKKKAV